jgi:hypothetical protein
MYGYTNDATGLTDDNPLVMDLTDQEETLIPKFENIWTIGSGKNAVNMTPDKKWHKEKYYKAIITIPYKEGSSAIVSSMVNRGPIEKVSSYSDVQKNIFNSANQPMGSSSAFDLNN